MYMLHLEEEQTDISQKKHRYGPFTQAFSGHVVCFANKNTGSAVDTFPENRTPIQSAWEHFVKIQDVFSLFQGANTDVPKIANACAEKKWFM